ncbi:AT-hook motif nuclear-localized protein 17 [Prunus avium]|uniref:AT-hook motif nuclear-localized protein n=1 Tax=Prunus avium TaxID=42229 RepID=A0A6P5RYP0_PRUAV|nr:AT-hook motif nuclear-localized protein 17 [Prunus avium]
MKGEYVDTKGETQSMFSKLHHPHHLQHQTQQHHQTQTQQHQHHHFPNPFQAITTHRECQTSEEEDTSRTSSGTATVTTNPSAQNPKSSAAADPSNPSADGATIEVIRRPRGRPPGSKNKPKPPVIITRDSEPPMSPYILEVPGGSDVVEAVSRFCCRKNIGLCILTGSGTVANVTLRQPSTTPGATVTFHGRFDILSISATFLPQTTPSCPVSVPSGFTISLAGPQGQIVGGLVAGALVAAGTVYVIAASFNNPSYHRLPGEDEAVRNSGSGDPHSPPLSGGVESGGHAPQPSQSCGMSMYSCHLPTDVLWAPTARQPPPPPPY